MCNQWIRGFFSPCHFSLVWVQGYLTAWNWGQWTCPMQGLPTCCMLTCITLATLPLKALLQPCIKHPTCWKSANLRLMRFLKKGHMHKTSHKHFIPQSWMFMYKYAWFYTVTDFVEIIWSNTLTDDSSVFRVVTVMNTKRVTATVHKFGLLPSTDHIVQKNGSSSLAKVCTPLGNCTCWDKCTFKPT